MQITIRFSEDFKYEHFASGAEYAAICVHDFLETNEEFAGMKDYSNKVFNARIIPQLGRHLLVKVEYWKLNAR